ncbi:glycosyltransferase family 2 protein [Nocardioides aurantiacus]|uniref:Cellulose synthase/poly-beta-1,6-N-acetylglucosamine synthase-like glycosyltransferase n=1 Tax=Nocardioides aurantiacus TaxID=86796 RepID=A0A3N2CTK6_9ACTN|nr:glycosyltransferase family 2 protein [Nocardioides aurantiacus]ROR90544.1 cellulose synthase/poly-beta-1,6-N-acetylglucosamine synthase-like glycosyltransferase [Nocardioides aurantiacus]
MTTFLPQSTVPAQRRARPRRTGVVTQPPVSVFMAVRDEQADLAASVARVLEQDYPGELEVVLAVAPSTDDTWGEAQRLAAHEPRVRVVRNPAGATPHGLNAAIAHARHDLLVRVDGHAHLPAGYLVDVVALLESTGAANVGGRMVPEGDTPVSRAVAVTMSSRLGIGGGAFHVGGEAGPQPTVYLGAFRREALVGVGGYDERFLRAQDWELNHRLRLAGHTVWFDPDVAVTYRPRSSWRTFAQQQLRTGGWRRRVIETHRGTADLRYLVPPVAVLTMVAGLLAGLAAPFLGAWLALGLLAPAVYAGGVTVLGLALARVRRLPRAVAWRMPLALAVMHLSWGTGFVLRAR